MMVALILLAVYALFMTFLAGLGAYRLTQHDRFNTFISSDIYDAAVYLGGLAKRDLFSNSPEIIAAHNQFAEIARNLERYRDIIKKSTFGENLKNEPKPKDKRPVFID